MSVASHLGIRLGEYDARIRTFIPDYDAMLDAAVPLVPSGSRTIVDLGIGTGAFSARCLRRASRAQVIGIDADDGMLNVAARRLGARLTPVHASFLRAPLPAADVVIASFALHHVRTRGAKAALYRRIRASLRPGGRLIVVDSLPAAERGLWHAQREAWLDHLRRAYSATKARGLLEAWAHEDVYVPLDTELEMMRQERLRVEVVWRRDAFAVVTGR